MHILIIVPESASYFHELSGHRIRDALQEIGHTVVLERLHTYPGGDYEWCFIINIIEVIHGYLRTGRGNVSDAVARISGIRSRTSYSVLVSMESVNTAWYIDNIRWADGLKIPYRFDMGYCKQFIPSKYNHFLFNGLTTAERRRLQTIDFNAKQRSIPWAFIGTFSTERLLLAERLVQNVDSQGILYLRNQESEAVGWNGPHIGYEQYLQILSKTKLSIWCSHHLNFYVESERFRLAALSGALPLKILSQTLPSNLDIPFQFLMLSFDNFEEVLQSLDYEATWYQFRDACLRLASLEDSLQRVMETIIAYG